MSVIIQENMSVQKKLEILSDAAKYDVACTSSGVDRKGIAGSLGTSVASGICHTFSADGRCISLLKILFTNECIFDCKYCFNRASNDIVRASFTPEEVCDLTIEFYRRNYIEGLFLSSGVLINPNHTMELICKTLKMLREDYHFNGYIHCKAVPGADSSIIEMAGWYADRMSVNLELPTTESLKQLAPHKSRKNILKPMKQIQLGRIESMESPIFGRISDKKLKSKYLMQDELEDNKAMVPEKSSVLGLVKRPAINRGFVPAGQSTQMIIGATPENDYQIMSVAEALYQKFDLKRVFYSAYISVNQDSNLPSLTSPPLLREHRLYQADWLLRFYGFEASELLSEQRPNFNVLIDPKCNWAIGHLEQFPIEINKADYYTLLRIPGVGVKSAQRIVKARRVSALNFEDLKKIGVVLKRALYFITCNGKMMYQTKIDENYITNQLISVKERLPYGIDGGISFQQLSLFDDVNFSAPNLQEFKSGIG
ncbi:putative DNA modification/repair radical SAM protein [Anaerocolumna cellulosilytica]|uniref:Putative DNA modification/repair radical SAM protein n=1 Tax=Anaerocolumna cellulosilytica TaxID=433286 RepID=A0A6S6QWZ6_9FIRM|nr:putative DNA modification/repair radical SAM protein [Anaerocolumna cellulosilytica]MBB5196864.1 putative DNA modification/repair radical SAM protein [Anaerocolumna cellulosilytica]BCJ95743.1 putative DNA modification/repair radical SAM protein [Anaerocolumna cellulosilytica]